MMTSLVPWLRLLGVSCLAFPAAALEGTGQVPPLPFAVVPAAATAPVIDGKLDDACWQQAVRITELRPALDAATLGEVDAAKAGEARTTEVLLTWRPEALLIGFRCHDSTVIATPGRPRDDTLYNEDVVEVFFDPLGDGHRYWEVQVSPLGQFTDALHMVTADPPPTPTGRLPADFYVRNHLFSLSENLADLSVAATATPDGWSAEIALPVAVLPRTPTGPGVFSPGLMRLNLVRYDWMAPHEQPGSHLHQASWSPVEYGCPHQSAGRMGWIKLVAP